MGREVMYLLHLLLSYSCFFLQKSAYIKTIKSVIIYSYFQLLLWILVLSFIFHKLFIQACNYWFYMLVSWFLLVHTWFTDETIYVHTNYKLLLLLLVRSCEIQNFCKIVMPCELSSFRMLFYGELQSYSRARKQNTSKSDFHLKILRSEKYYRMLQRFPSVCNFLFSTTYSRVRPNRKEDTRQTKWILIN